MDRPTIEAIQHARRHVDLDQHRAFFDGFAAGMACILDAHDEGRLTPDVVQAIRDHICLYKEHRA